MLDDFPSASSESGYFKSSELSPKYDPTAIGLAFSGGGYRATLFHAGALLRLNELGILGRAQRITSVSGGSIATGILAMNWDLMSWDSGRASHDQMIDHFIKPVLAATSTSVDIMTTLKGLIPGISGGNALARAYDRHIFHDRKLSTITKKTRFIFCAMNLQTGGLTRFNHHYVADWRAFRSTTKTIKLSTAVAASSAFPPILAPVRLDLSGEDVSCPAGARYTDPALQTAPVLVDGGTYDNIGLEPIWKRCGILIAANAGQNIPSLHKQFQWWPGMMMRIINSFLDVSVDWRERSLINLYRNMLRDGLPERRGAYWSIATDPDDLEWTGYKASDAMLQIARDMDTRLKRFEPEVQRAAILAGYSYADGTVRKYLMPNAPAPSEPVLP
ncbi:patatin-like phospholipase family protein [Litoreibacter roseus]|uniref:Patatin n=1 Tax=Litoreibacter roseus TaxID=2601869 RepID=A0A6N6JD24_9RHOB|nr:patatin-like phospholipase family protein [Litoreibacter roseus]GFE64241.1 patatin [Litoreibacter roseus]